MSDNGTQVVETPVLIIGGGAAGLMTSLLLGQLGIESLLVERHPGTSLVPKAHIIHSRTMEVFKQAELENEVRSIACPPENFQHTSWYTSLGGDEAWDNKLLASIPSWGAGGLEEFYAERTAQTMTNLPQHLLEPVLRARAEQLQGVERVRFNEEFTELEQDEDGVLSTILDRATGESYRVRSQYVVGADGGKTVGAMLGVPMLGPKPFVDVVSITFEADFSEYLQEDASLIRLFLQPAPDGTVRRFSIVASGPAPWDRHCRQWRSGVILPKGMELGQEYTEADAVEELRGLFKLPDLEMTNITMSAWLMESVLAERFQVGRVFLAGDAAHRHSPMGGLGLNTGIQDAHNLAWKLAAVLKGHAAPELLDSYEPERLPVCKRRVEFATFSFFNHLGVSGGFGMLPGASEEHNREVLEALFSDTEDGATRRAELDEMLWTLRREFQHADIDLGFDYAASPTVIGDGTEPPPHDPVGKDYIQTARPGHRMPHAWLHRDGVAVPTHELIEPGTFVVLTGANGDAWAEAAAQLAQETGAPVTALRVGAGADLEDADGAWTRLRVHDEDGAILVRPDGHVAYRALSRSADPRADLARALHAALGSGSPAPSVAAGT